MDIFCSTLWEIALIHVIPGNEPADFDEKVRQPGINFLNTTPHPTRRAWRRHDYWRRAIGDLLDVYHNICSYSGSWTNAHNRFEPTLRDHSLDHFIPKSSDPTLAYEWRNFRLSRVRLNNRKGNNEDVLDPFTLHSRWFTLNFYSYLIFPEGALSVGNMMRVQTTIDRLGLNTDNDYVQERANVVQEYCLGNYTLATLDRYWPFIASEMRAQDFDTNILPEMQPCF